MISLKTPQEIKVMREGGKILATIVKELISQVKPGITTNDIDRAAEALILRSGAKIAFRGYHNFPGVLCTAIDQQIVHVPPSDRVLQEGEILTLDIGLKWKGWFLDMARTVPVGNVDEEKMRLINATREALAIGIKHAKAGVTLGRLGGVIQQHIEEQGYGVVRELCGHGIGKEIHEDPRVLNFKEKGDGTKLKEGMVICIEPMVTVGDWRLKIAEDGYSFETKDGSISCHFEDTIAITKKGPSVLTRTT